MKTKKQLLGEAMVNQGTKMVARQRRRLVQALLLFLCGGALLYLGLTQDTPVFTAFGIIFTAYAFLMRFHIPRVKKVNAELEGELKKLMDQASAEDARDTQQNIRQVSSESAPGASPVEPSM